MALRSGSTRLLKSQIEEARSGDSVGKVAELILDSVSLVTMPGNGVAQINGSGAIRYTPNGGFIGSDGYIYQICDFGGNCSQASVSINVV